MLTAGGVRNLCVTYSNEAFTNTTWGLDVDTFLATTSVPSMTTACREESTVRVMLEWLLPRTIFTCVKHGEMRHFRCVFHTDAARVLHWMYVLIKLQHERTSPRMWMEGILTPFDHHYPP